MAAHRARSSRLPELHGKTTTTGMLGVMLQHAGLDPTVFVGGEVANLGGNVRVGARNRPVRRGSLRSLRLFLHLKPDIAILTNVEADHLDHYGTKESVFAGFRRFLEGVAPTGQLIVCGDNPGVQEVFEGAAFAPTRLEYGLEIGSTAGRGRKISASNAARRSTGTATIRISGFICACRVAITY